MELLIESDDAVESADWPIAGPLVPDLDIKSLLPPISTEGLSMPCTAGSCRSMQIHSEPYSLPASECSQAPFGIPEHLRISDALIGLHEDTGVKVTLFRKPSSFHNEWEIWNEFVNYNC